MVAAAIRDYLKRPPEQVRLAELYPELPRPIPFADASPEGPFDDAADDAEAPPQDERHVYYIAMAIPDGAGTASTSFAVTAQHHRIVCEYGAALERQSDAREACAAARWRISAPPPARAPEPEDVPHGGRLTPRQEEFCLHYAAQPIATRAAILAGYAEANAAPYGSRLLNNPLVLDRIARLRTERHIRYVVERDTVHDKLEAVYFDALGERKHAAAVSALRLQAALAGMLGRAAAKREAKKSQGAAGEKPTKAKAARAAKPRKAKADSRRKPRKAKKSQ
ncbi:MAG: terminase small subunit [Alphaproteobacteria bacterium]